MGRVSWCLAMALAAASSASSAGTSEAQLWRTHACPTRAMPAFHCQLAAHTGTRETFRMALRTAWACTRAWMGRSSEGSTCWASATGEAPLHAKDCFFNRPCSPTDEPPCSLLHESAHSPLLPASTALPAVLFPFTGSEVASLRGWDHNICMGFVTGAVRWWT